MSHDDDLTQMFESARKAAPEPSSDFLARVLADAQAMQPAAAGVMTRAPLQRNSIAEFFSTLGDMIGGWPGFAGLASAAVAGVWIGISPPDTLIDPISAVLGGESSALFETLETDSGFDFTLFEG